LNEKRRARSRILIVDDDRALLETLSDGLGDAGYETATMTKSADATAALQRPEFDALVTDLRMPGEDGIALLGISKRAAPERPVIVMTAYSAVDSAIESIRRGAYHYLTKPFKVQELALFLGRSLEEATLRREAKTLRRALRDGSSLDNVIGRSGGMREVCSLVTRVADADVPVLLLGETGTGKGVIARALHNEGRRGSGPFVTVNSAALPEQLLESELFGHVKGAFTGATSSRRGLLEEADGGTLFLDEIGEMALGLQAKLLGVLESGVVRAVGANREVSVDVRFLAATHRDLRALVGAGQFREDLLFRLDVVSIEIPPLRQRKGDVPELVAHFLSAARRKHPGSPVKRLSAAAMMRVMNHAWPGNVRELEHVIERLVLLGASEEGALDDLPRTLAVAEPHAPGFAGPVEKLETIERRYAAWALEQLDGRRMLTAERLDIDRKTLARLLGGET
jgi:two-component system, NtrC family, response regulator HydG